MNNMIFRLNEWNSFCSVFFNFFFHYSFYIRINKFMSRPHYSALMPKYTFTHKFTKIIKKNIYNTRRISFNRLCTYWLIVTHCWCANYFSESFFFCFLEKNFAIARVNLCMHRVCCNCRILHSLNQLLTNFLIPFFSNKKKGKMVGSQNKSMSEITWS